MRIQGNQFIQSQYILRSRFNVWNNSFIDHDDLNYQDRNHRCVLKK